MKQFYTDQIEKSARIDRLIDCLYARLPGYGVV